MGDRAAATLTVYALDDPGGRVVFDTRLGPPQWVPAVAGEGPTRQEVLVSLISEFFENIDWCEAIGNQLVLSATYTAEEASLGIGSEIEKAFIRLGGVTFEVTQDAKYDSDGYAIFHAPDLGTWEGPWSNEGVMVSARLLDGLADEINDGDPVERLHRMTGKPWRDRFDELRCRWQPMNADECAGMREREVAGKSNVIPVCPVHGPHSDDLVAEQHFIVVIEENGVRSALSRRSHRLERFDGPWRLLTDEEATELAAVWNADDRNISEAFVAEVYRYDNDPAWPEEEA